MVEDVTRVGGGHKRLQEKYKKREKHTKKKKTSKKSRVGWGGHLIFSINVYIFHVTLYLGSMYSLQFHGCSLSGQPIAHSIMLWFQKRKKKKKKILRGKLLLPSCVLKLTTTYKCTFFKRCIFSLIYLFFNLSDITGSILTRLWDCWPGPMLVWSCSKTVI